MVSVSRAAISLCAAAMVSGCDATAPVPEFDEAPMVALLLTPDPPPRFDGALPDSGLYAALFTTGTPARSPYLRADRFEMRRVADGALFAWRPTPPPNEALGVFSGVLGNYFLPRVGDATGLGSDSLTPGAVYELVVEAGLQRIVGRTRIPGPIEFVRAATDGDSVVRWRRVPGAAGYAVGAESFIFAGPLITDTAAIVHRDQLRPGRSTQPPTVRIFAVDANYAAFQGDFRVSQSGITGGWGVFGSFTWADAELPLRTASAAPR